MESVKNAMSDIHPLQAIQETLGGAGVDPRPLQRSSLFNNANDGPAGIIAKVSGVQSGGKRKDDGPYFTNNEGIPFPDPAVCQSLCCCAVIVRLHLLFFLRRVNDELTTNKQHSKTVGGLPLISDTFLLQKQQHFNRSKNLESTCSSDFCMEYQLTQDRNGTSLWKWSVWLLRDDC